MGARLAAAGRPLSTRCRVGARVVLITVLVGCSPSAVACDQGIGIRELREGIESGDLSGSDVHVRGVVSGRFPGHGGLNGFFIQQRSTAQPPAGVFVYTPDRDAPRIPARGRRVTVHGQAGSHRGHPQLEWVERIADCGATDLRPVSVTPPMDRERLRRLAGVLVRFAEPLVVTGNGGLRRWGVLRLASGRRLFHSSTGISGGRRAGLVLDDGSYKTKPRPVPYWHAEHGRRIGSELVDAEGILVERFGEWRLHPIDEPTFSERNPRAQPPTRPDAVVRVASLNLNNFFPVTRARGPDDEVVRERRETAVIQALAAMNADVLVVQELANNKAAARMLRRRLNAVSGHEYRYARGAVPLGDDAIRVAILVRDDRVSVRGTAVLRDGSHNRPPLTARLETPAGTNLAITAVHLKSRGGCDDADPCGVQRRREQVRALKHGIATDDATPSIIMGDFNSYRHETPIERLVQAGLEPGVSSQLAPRDRYTYVHEGRSGVLDYALMDTEARELSRSGHIWHLGADEAQLPAPSGGPWGASDHDAVIVDLTNR